MSGDAQTSPPPPVMWAQRAKTILLTICLEDCKKPDIKISNESVYFKGVGGTDKKEYEVTINLYKEIDPEVSLYSIRDRIIEFTLSKKDKGPFWPYLTKEKVKYHWLKVDFDKWQDENDSDSDGNLNNFADYLSKMEDRDDDIVNIKDILEPDSDDGDLPDLE